VPRGSGARSDVLRVVEVDGVEHALAEARSLLGRPGAAARPRLTAL
jgi:hypothetical protein